MYSNQRLTVIGTMRKNKREIPPELLDVKCRQLNSSILAFGERSSNNCLIRSYRKKEKQENDVLMLSTMHSDDAIDADSGEANKPEIITFYSLTKGRVTVVDCLKSEYCASRIINCWPLILFFSLLNIASINAQIIYKKNQDVTTALKGKTDSLSIAAIIVPTLSVKNIQRRVFLRARSTCHKKPYINLKSKKECG
ncbi:uncharacterized protein LOC126419599 [Schistocerca serialis cubense]|uniref:uncharacterized protein LOC126419599 n=1 Tax=Schistocerca serialis cubense TaxID=2023355 RepID=UPI00214F12EE|nr:uncharacterized protein LOC126419599 [Schistocerca serialis cubense]